MSRLSIIVPVYWNSDTLMLLYEDMREKILHKLGDYEIVFVDDGSGDNSWEIMNQIRDMDKRVKLVKLSRNFGEHAAILEGNKVVLAVRSDRDEGAIQKFFANLYYTLMRKLVIKDMPKGGFDCYLLDRQVIKVLMMLDEKNSALTLQVLWVGFKSDKVYFHRKAREIGESRWTLSKKIKLVLDSMMSFSYFPVRFMSGMGTAFAFAAVIWAVILVVQRLNGIEDVAGWTSMMVLMLFGFGLIMVMLGLLGEYIWRALDASRNRPPFLVDETRGFEDKE